MSKAYFLSSTESGKARNFTQFRDNIGPYTATFGLDAADLSQQAKDATYYSELLTLAGTMGDAGQQWTKWKSTALTGSAGTEPILPAKLASFPASVPAGILPRYLTLVKAIKNHKAYTPVIGQILGIEGAEQAGPDLDALQPVFTLVLTGGVVKVLWNWGGNSAYLDLCELRVDRNDGKGFTLLAMDSTPGYEDSFGFPATPTKWSYKAIYRVGDNQVGQWSAEVSITVGG